MPPQLLPTLYLNENIDIKLVSLLADRGIKALHAITVKNRKLTDEFQLEYAAKNRYIILTHNRWDYRKIHEKWTRQGKTHSGILGIGTGEPSYLADRVEKFFRDTYPSLKSPFYHVPPHIS